jgi:hypothetical protein
LGNSKQAKDSTEVANEKFVQFEEWEPDKFVLWQGWLREVWNKWPGDESVEELLGALKE